MPSVAIRMLLHFAVFAKFYLWYIRRLRKSLAKTMPLLPGYRPLRGFIEFYLVALPLR
ncbi:hypothetical protein CAMGR0001_1483 [Campylobacter gracilis RM3268]|uniref:Uncharacterized protein n=1 Tax=Campylobacter gracilis RM3268 TaxID=553220 RepID=C8PJT3_9BACT|nr:hypothetical protein CAMGR0001_1483 [Campylobacter gracilis RM3268]